MSVQQIIDEGPIVPEPEWHPLNEDEFADGTAIFFDNGQRGQWVTCDGQHVWLLEAME